MSVIQEGELSIQENPEMKRWYDKYPKLARCLDSFKDMHPKARDNLVKGVLTLISENDPNTIMENFVMEFPLDIYKKRWYDDDPYLWLIFNSLKNANNTLKDKVTSFLEENLGFNGAAL